MEQFRQRECPNTTLYSDDFSGSGGVLNGTVPDIVNSSDPFVDPTWFAGETTFFDDGTIDSDENNPGAGGGRGGGAAYLPFVPDAGQIYTHSQLLVRHCAT